jgi:hypothetical protein
LCKKNNLFCYHRLKSAWRDWKKSNSIYTAQYFQHISYGDGTKSISIIVIDGKKEGSSLKKTLICIKKCLLLFWMRKKFVIIQKQYYPAIADVVPYKLHLFIFVSIAISWRPKKMGKFLLAKLVQYSGVSKTRKKSCASYACVKVTCIFNKLNGEPNIVRLLVFLWKNSFVNTNSLQIYTQTCCDHFLSFVDSLYVQDEFTVDLKKMQ